MARTERTEPQNERLGKKRRWLRIHTALTYRWKGAILALCTTVGLIYLINGFNWLGSRGLRDTLTGTVVSIIVVVLISGILAGIFHYIKRLSTLYFWTALASFILLVICWINTLEVGLILALCAIIALSILGALLNGWNTKRYANYTLKSKIVLICLGSFMVLFLGAGGYWLLQSGNPDLPLPYRLQTMKADDRYAVSMDNPVQPGEYEVRFVTYGNENNYRDDFNQLDSLLTESVDGSAFVDNWSKSREKTFGFGPEQMPLNGLVWYPDGEGTFPLVIAVHGNHIATEYSDWGYEYLGRLLASRGYIFVSIDQNFLNASPYDDLLIFNTLKNENPARGWLILEHLKLWEEWNETQDQLFFGKVNMSRIALIGHSRGAEGITTAAAFNKMSAYPEEATIKFDYGYDIRSLIAISGTDGLYKPAGKPLVLEDVNYLALHGSHDMDVSSFRTASQFHRINFIRDTDYFKSSVYIYGANHGQFNTEWGRHDSIGLNNNIFNLAQLMPEEDQLEAAKVLISSFLEVTLKERYELRKVFQDLGFARDWLPDTMYISNYWDSNTTLIGNFEEDADPGTTTIPGGRFAGENLTLWSEEKVNMKFSPDLYSAVKLGWDSSAKGIARFTVHLEETDLAVGENTAIVFSLADSRLDVAVDEKEELVDLTIAVKDRQGNEAIMLLSSESYLLPMLEGNILKFPFTFFSPTKEPVFQNYSIALNDLQRNNPEFEMSELKEISFVFDQTPVGSVYLKDIGVRMMNND